MTRTDTRALPLDLMMNALNILLVSRSKEELDGLDRLLRGEGLSVQRQHTTNGHVDPLYGVQELPDVLVLHLSHVWRQELEALAARRPENRPALIVVGASTDMGMMRLAMQAGARDLLSSPVSKSDLLEAIARVARDRQAPVRREPGAITAFINAKGGCGATLLACNVAHTLAASSRQRTALLDLDLQFGAAPLYLDLFPKRGVRQALENLAGLDEVALEGYFVRHASGLNVLSHTAEEPIMMQDVSAAAVGRLLEVMLRGHERVVVDLPRRLDGMTKQVLEQARQVVVVLQQSVTALRDAGRLLQWLRTETALDRSRLCVVVNRYEKAAPVSVADIRKALGNEEPLLVPNDFRSVSECINSGMALLEYANGSPIARSIMALETRLGGTSAQKPGSGLLTRLANHISVARKPQ